MQKKKPNIKKYKINANKTKLNNSRNSQQRQEPC